MAFDILPTAATNFTDHKFLEQFPKAIDEKVIAATGGRFGRGAHVYDTFTITAIVDNGDGTFTITDSSKATDPIWAATSGWPTSPPRWFEWDATLSGPSWAWPSYDVVLDLPCFSAGRDPRGVIQAHIVAANGATTLTVSNLAEFITSRACPSLASLVGHSGKIIRRDGVNWTRGWPDWPNSVVYASGVVKSSGVGTLTSKNALRHLPLIGKDILYRDVANVLQRGRITKVVGGITPTYTGTTALAAVDGEFFVVDANAYFQWGRKSMTIHGFYRGLREGYWAHVPHDNSIGVAYMPAFRSAPLSLGTVAGFCPSPETQDVYYIDFWIDHDIICEGDRDRPLEPDALKTIGMWWQVLGNIIGNFAEPDTDFDSASGIGPWTEATWLYYANINPLSGTAGTHTVTGLPISLSVPYTPINIIYTVLTINGGIVTSGTGLYDGTELSGSFTAASDGLTVIASLGPTRVVPRRFSRMYDQWFFKPAVQDLGGGPVAIIPPTDVDPGTWLFIPKSTHYLAASANGGFVAESELAIDAINEDDLARYVGQQYSDPGLIPNFVASLPMDPIVPFYHNSHVGTRSQLVQAQIDGSKVGIATGGSRRRTIATDRDWLSVDFYGPTNGLTHTGTGGAGSSTTQLVDATKAGTGLWAASRFVIAGFPNGPLTGFTIEWLITGSSFDDPNAVIEKRLVKTGNGVTGTLIWDEALPVSGFGLNYRIVEPLVLNRWAQRKVQVFKPDPSSPGASLRDELILDGNCGDTLFHPEAVFAIDNTTRFRIIDPPCGGIWKRHLGQWIVPTGTDPRAPNPKFKAAQSFNCEDHVHRYGKPLPIDDTPSFLIGWEELIRAFVVMKRTFHGTTVTSNDEDSRKIANLEERYQAPGEDTPDGRHYWTWTERETNVSGIYTAYTPTTDTQIPKAYSTSTKDAHGPSPFDPPNTQQATIVMERTCSYFETNVNGPIADCPLYPSMEWFVYGFIDADDHPAGVFDTGSTPPDNWAYVFNDNGDTISYHLWRRFSTTSLTTPTQRSSKFGGLAAPPLTSEPPDADYLVGGSSLRFAGYYVGAACALANWTGMKYV